MNEELFQLCKEVYKRFPEWYGSDMCWHYTDRFGDGNYIRMKGANGTSIPEYDSDYLENKMRDFIGRFLLRPITDDLRGRWVLFADNINAIYGNSGLECRLKLVIALADAGVKL